MKLTKYVVLLMVIGVTLVGCRPTPSTDKVVIAASIFPVYDMLKNVGGDTVEPILMIDPGQSPHTFEPEPKDIRALSNAKAILHIGHQLDDWALDLASSKSQVKIYSIDDNINLLPSVDHHHDEDEHEEEHDEAKEAAADPHYWLSPENALIMTQNITDILIEIDPQNARTYQSNANDYVESLNMLIDDKNSRLTNTQKDIITFHGAWQYFAQSLDLNIAAVFEPFPGESPTPQYVREFQEAIEESNAAYIYTEPQLNTPVLQTLANDMGVEIRVLDPLGGFDDRDSYISLMQYNINQVLND